MKRTVETTLWSKLQNVETLRKKNPSGINKTMNWRPQVYEKRAEFFPRPIASWFADYDNLNFSGMDVISFSVRAMRFSMLLKPFTAFKINTKFCSETP